MRSVTSITGIAGLTMFFPYLVLFSVSDFLRMASIWRQDAIIQPRSMIQKLGMKLGSVPS